MTNFSTYSIGMIEIAIKDDLELIKKHGKMIHNCEKDLQELFNELYKRNK